jgi:hypothetical protein
MPLHVDNNDEWYESEESTRRGLIQEVQRIKRRTIVRPIPVILLALVITGGIVYKVATKKHQYEAEIVLAIKEGAMLNQDKNTGLPVEELKELVSTVLLPDAKLADLIERRNLHRLRDKFGMKWAIAELRDQIAIDVWKNSFIYYDPDESNRFAQARVGLTVVDDDPDGAFLLAHDLAAIVIDEVREHRLDIAKKVSSQVAELREVMTTRLQNLELERATKMVAVAEAHRDHKATLAQALKIQLLAIDDQQKQTEKTLSDIAQSQDVLADRVAAAGLDLVIEIVSEKRPDRPESQGLLIAIIAVVVGLGALIGSALVLGAFDSRVHDTDDVERLGLPVLGHVPGFAGDKVGSLEARGVQRARVPSFLRWRSQR